VAVEGGLDPFGPRELVRSHHLHVGGISAGQISIRRCLVPLRGTLVGIGLILVAVGGRLVRVGGRLIQISRRLVHSRGRLIGLLPSSVPTPAHTRFLFSD
jgi:hypothetical protein